MFSSPARRAWTARARARKGWQGGKGSSARARLELENKSAICPQKNHPPARASFITNIITARAALASCRPLAARSSAVHRRITQRTPSPAPPWRARARHETRSEFQTPLIPAIPARRRVRRRAVRVTNAHHHEKPAPRLQFHAVDNMPNPLLRQADDGYHPCHARTILVPPPCPQNNPTADPKPLRAPSTLTPCMAREPWDGPAS